MDKLKESLYYLKRILANVEQNEFIPLRHDEVVLGRQELPGEHISRRHARFKRIGDKWTVANLGRNGVFVNGDIVGDGKEYSLSVGSVIQFGQPDTFVYRFKVKQTELGTEGAQGGSAKKTKLNDDRYGVESNLSHAREDLERQLRESDVLQARLQEERDQLHQYLYHQQNQLTQRYNTEKEQLEQKYADGALAQQSLLQEKESLARILKAQVSELKSRLEDDRTALEDRLLKEEEQRNHILQEKENVVRRLEEENAQRARLEEQLKTTEILKEELKQQVETITSAARVREAEQQQAEEERQRQQNELTTERERLMQELDRVKTTLVQKEMTNALLDSELKEKEQLRTKLASVEEEMKARIATEVKKSAELVQEETKKQLDEMMGERSKLEEQLKVTKAHDQVQRSILQEELDLLEAQKMSLEQELANSVVCSEHAKKEVVELVSDVLENEFQCPICNDLFITAVMLNCSHTFCRYCIDRWKKNKNDCPNCRVPIVSETRSLVVDNFIDKIVPTLSKDMKKRRAVIVAERKAEMEAQAIAAAAAAAAAAAWEQMRGRGRGRPRRVTRGRGRGRGGWRQTPAQIGSGTGGRLRTSQAGTSHTTHPQPPSTEAHNLHNANQPAVVVSSNSEASDASHLSDSSSVSGDENDMAYYGGFGRCFTCGRRGHWANNCPGEW